MTPRQAARRVRELQAEMVTVELWLRCWTEYFPGERAEATVVHDAYMLAPFLELHGHRLLGDVTRLEAQAWSVAHPSQLRYLRRVWGKAVVVGLVERNVWESVQLPRRTGGSRPVPSIEQLDAAIAAARAREGWWLEFADLVEATAFTGARLGGMASLRRSAVDLGARRMVLTEKGEKTRTVVLAPRSEAALRSASLRVATRLRERDPLLFMSRARRPLHRNMVGEAWRAVRGDFDGPFHSLKHFAGTWLASMGVDERDIAIQLGHVDSQGRPYTHLVRRVYVHPDHDSALMRVEEATR